ncbi:MAG: hemolysin family protein [bacterium]
MELFAGFLLILITGFYGGSETALYSANWIRLNHWAKNRLAGARDALVALEKIGPTLTAALIGTNLASVFATLLIEQYFVAYLGAGFTPLAVILVVLLTLIFGDYLPKALAQASPNRWLRQTAFGLNFSRVVFTPITYFIVKILPYNRNNNLSRDDFLKVIAQREQVPVNRPTTANMVARLFRFSQMKVGEVSIPLKQVKSVSDEADSNAILTIINEFGYSRIPVYSRTRDNIIGVIVAKDLLRLAARSDATPFSEKKFPVRPVRSISENTRALDVLRQMQQHGEHLMVVINAAGKTHGIVTLEDLIEELVGEIRSED